MAYTTIDDPSAHFHIQLYTGSGSSGNSITNDANAGDFKPDWLWIKPRSITDNHVVFDSSRGQDRQLKPNGTDAEDTHSPARITFETDGFDIDTTDQNYNQSSATYIAWQWKANGGTTTTNDASATSIGTIDSVIQANTTAGFSIVTHTGSGSAGNIAHGLGAVPEWVLTKNRVTAASWANYHASVGNEYYLELDTTDARETASSVWGDTTPSSTTFRVGGANTKNNSGSGDTFVSYCFTPIQGYSKFGKYTGNGNADGAFIYTGFKPAWFMCKQTNTSRSWTLIDNKRPEINSDDTKALIPNENGTEENIDADFLSNGLKIRQNHTAINQSGGTYIYMAFAQHPFVSSKGVPTTAR